MKNQSLKKWDLVIEPNNSWFKLNFESIYNYKDLLFMFVKRDIITIYKQTILGPIWFVIQPVFTTITYIFIFGKVAGLSTEGIPMPLFYLSGIVLWGYFSESFNKTCNTFSQNANIFGKVYFPREILPISKVISAFIKFAVQFVVFLIFYFYYLIRYPEIINPNLSILLFPILLIIMAFFGLGFGLIFSSLTTKYKDLTFLIQFGIQLLMFSTPIIYPISIVSDGSLTRLILELNPISYVIETFKYSFIGNGSFSFNGLAYSFSSSFLILFLGLIIFNKTEKTFMDTV